MTYFRCTGVWCRQVVRVELPACPRCGLPMLPYRPAWAEPKQLPLFKGGAGA